MRIEALPCLSQTAMLLAANVSELFDHLRCGGFELVQEDAATLLIIKVHPQLLHFPAKTDIPADGAEILERRFALHVRIEVPPSCHNSAKTPPKQFAKC
jgi:hypothetical protein